MPSFVDVITGALAKASDVQQIIDALKGTAGKGIPLSLTSVNDAINFALSVKNNDATASKTAVFYKADGTVLFQIDKNGVIASADGTTSASQIPTLTGAQTLTNKTLTAPVITSPTLSGGVFGAYTTWVPAVSQPAGLTATINYATYQQIGKLALVTANITITSAGTTANRIVVSTLPITPKYVGSGGCIGTYTYTRTVGAVIYSGSVVPTSAAVAAFEVPGAAGEYMGVQPGFAAANTDILSFTLCYEAA